MISINKNCSSVFKLFKTTQHCNGLTTEMFEMGNRYWYWYIGIGSSIGIYWREISWDLSISWDLTTPLPPQEELLSISWVFKNGSQT